MPMDSRPPSFQHIHGAPQNWNHQNIAYAQQQPPPSSGGLPRRLSTPAMKSGGNMAPPVTTPHNVAIPATQHLAGLHPTSPALPPHLGAAPGMPQMGQPAMGLNQPQMMLQPSTTTNPNPPLAGGGGGAQEPPWECLFSKPIGNPEAQKLTKFNITEASGGSLEGAVALLNKLGEVYPHNYAVVYRKTLQQFFLVGRRGTPVSASSAIAAHEKFVTATTDAPKTHKPWKARDKAERQQYPLEDRLTKHLVGQRPSILSVAAQLRRKENGWHSTEHPLVFLFMGSSGIGKTELAKQVAKYLHEDSADAFIRLDMTEYQQPHEVSKFIGAPPGYLGHDESGQLTRRLKQCPDAVVLFDEVEKAHPDILTCLLQTFDEGRLTDGKGETVECMDAIFVMTSNLLQAEIANESHRVREKLKAEGVQDPDEMEIISSDFKEKVVLPALKRSFKRDEFVGRINEILFFLPFTQVQLEQLAIRELNKWKENASSRHGISLTWDEAVVRRLAEFYNIRYGARSIQHEMERRVVNRLAQAHEKDQIGKGSRVHLALGGKDNQEIVVYAM